MGLWAQRCSLRLLARLGGRLVQGTSQNPRKIFVLTHMFFSQLVGALDSCW